MPRINIEPELWDDPRFDELSRKLGGKSFAVGCLVFAWKISQRYWGHGRKMVPKTIFMRLDGAKEMLECDLSIEDGDFVYVRGSKQYHEWYATRVESAAKGGAAFAESLKNSESKRKANESKLRPSYSSSSSEEKNKHTKPHAPRVASERLVEIWNSLPHRPRDPRAPAIAKLSKLSEQDLCQVEIAAKNYKRFIQVNPPSEERFIPATLVWLNQRRWEDFLEDVYDERHPKKVMLFDPDRGVVESES